MNTDVHSNHRQLGDAEPLGLGRWVGLQGRLARPYWGLLGGWSALCGALASNQVQWDGVSLLSLGLVLVLADLAWGSLWDLTASTDWFGLASGGWAPIRSRLAFALPYTLPESPGGRLARFVEWLRDLYWPAVGAALTGALAAAGLALIVSLLLPARIRIPTAAFVALLGVAVVWRKQGRTPLAAQSLVQVGLSWMLGHLVFAEMGQASWALALAFAAAAWGALRSAKGLSAGPLLLNGGLAASIFVIAASKQPLAAGLMGFLYLGVLALQLVLVRSSEPDLLRFHTRMGPWLMGIMLVAALAVP